MINRSSDGTHHHLVIVFYMIAQRVRTGREREKEWESVTTCGIPIFFVPFAVHNIIIVVHDDGRFADKKKKKKHHYKCAASSSITYVQIFIYTVRLKSYIGMFKYFPVWYKLRPGTVSERSAVTHCDRAPYANRDQDVILCFPNVWKSRAARLLSERVLRIVRVSTMSTTSGGLKTRMFRKPRTLAQVRVDGMGYGVEGDENTCISILYGYW